MAFKFHFRIWLLLVIGTVWTVATAAPILAAESWQSPRSWTLRISATGAAFDFEETLRSGHVGVRQFSIDDTTLGLAIAVEYRIWQRFGVELGTLQFADPDYTVVVSDLGVSVQFHGELEFRPLLLGVNVHLTPRQDFDLYAGLSYARVVLGDFGSFGGDVLDDDNAVGYRLGFDRPFGEGRWALHADVTYLDVLFRFPNSGFFDVKPLYLSAGVAYRF